MNDRIDVKHFGYRTPRYPFPRMVQVETPHEVGSNVVTHGIDISVDGIAVAAEISFDPVKPVVLVIPLLEGSVARVPARVLCQSEGQCRFTFEFETAEQRTKIEELISELAET